MVLINELQTRISNLNTAMELLLRLEYGLITAKLIHANLEITTQILNLEFIRNYWTNARYSLNFNDIH